MIEPRLSLLHLHRRDLSKKEETNTSFNVLYDPPERPIHPALEYEVFIEEDKDADDHSDVQSITEDRINNNQTDKEDHYEENDRRGPTEIPVNYSSAFWIDPKGTTKRVIKLLLSFIFLLISGTGTVVSMKLQTIPMYNYPNFLNLFCHFLYIPICFLYIVPMVARSHITPDQIAISRKPFMIMGALDCLASTLQLFASVYLPGNLLVLLPQAVIPCNMFLSYLLLRERYHWRQYLGAVIVLFGLVVVLEPVITYQRSPDFYCEPINPSNDCTLCQTEYTELACLSHVQPIYGDEDDWMNTNHTATFHNVCQWLPYQQASKKEEALTLFWSLLLLSSAIPMTLSAIYKQVALDVAKLDPVYLNGWISIFQFLFALIVAVPAAWMTGVAPWDVPRNMWDGLLCFLGIGTIDSGCHPDECSSNTPILVGSYLACAILYSICMLCVLKYGSTSTLFMAQTILVPVGNLAFSLPLFHQSSLSYTSDMMGLIIIISGLILYRFWGEDDSSSFGSDEQSHVTNPWVRQLIQDQGDTPSPWYLDMVQNLRAQVQSTGSTPWLNDLLRHMREPLLEESFDSQ